MRRWKDSRVGKEKGGRRREREKERGKGERRESVFELV